MANESSPSFVKIALAVATGTLLATVITEFARYEIRDINQRAALVDLEHMAADRDAVIECRKDASRKAKTIADLPTLSAPCDVLAATFREKWGRYLDE